MKVQRTPGAKLELWVKDTGAFDGYQVYFAGNCVASCVDQSTHAYVLPAGSLLTVIVQFNGNDSGVSAIVDNRARDDQKSLANQDGRTGMQHVYIIQ